MHGFRFCTTSGHGLAVTVRSACCCLLSYCFLSNLRGDVASAALVSALLGLSDCSCALGCVNLRALVVAFVVESWAHRRLKIGLQCCVHIVQFWGPGDFSDAGTVFLAACMGGREVWCDFHLLSLYKVILVPLASLDFSLHL